MIHRFFLLSGWLVTTACLLAGCQDAQTTTPSTPVASGDTSTTPINQVATIGKVEPEAETTNLSPQVGGVVTRITAGENQTVARGQLILELDHRIEDAKIAQIRARLHSRRMQVTTDELSVREVASKLTNAQTELGRLTNLLSKGAETRQAVDNAQTQVQTLAANRDRLQSVVAVSKAALAEIQADLVLAEAERDQKRLRAPVAGELIDLSVRLGEDLTPGQVYGQLRPQGPTIVRAEVDELLVDRVRPGQSALIRKAGSTQPIAHGQVYFTAAYLKKKSLFADVPGEAEDRRVREVKIRLDSAHQLLLNQRVECLINL